MALIFSWHAALHLLYPSDTKSTISNLFHCLEVISTWMQGSWLKLNSDKAEEWKAKMKKLQLDRTIAACLLSNIGHQVHIASLLTLQAPYWTQSQMQSHLFDPDIQSSPLPPGDCPYLPKRPPLFLQPRPPTTAMSFMNDRNISFKGEVWQHGT